MQPSGFTSYLLSRSNIYFRIAPMLYLPRHAQSRLFIYDLTVADRHVHPPGQFHACERGILCL